MKGKFIITEVNPFRFVVTQLNRFKFVVTEVNPKRFVITNIENPYPDGSCTDLLIDNATSIGFDLNWINNSRDHTEIQLHISVSGGAYSLYKTLAAAFETYTADDLEASTEYSFKVVASKNGYLSDYSNVVTGTTASSFDAASLALFARIIAAGETMTDAWKAAMDVFIKGLKADGNWTELFEVFVITRGFGDAQTKMNIITDTFTAEGVNGPVRANDVGYKSNGTTSYLKSNFIPNNSSLFLLNDAGWMYKSGGVIAETNRYHGGGSGATNYTLQGGDGKRLNGAPGPSTPHVLGYNGLTRNNTTTFDVYRNDNKSTITATSTGRTSLQLYNLALNANGNAGYFKVNTETLEFYAYCKSYTQTQFNQVRSRLDTFFATYQ